MLLAWVSTSLKYKYMKKIIIILLAIPLLIGAGCIYQSDTKPTSQNNGMTQEEGVLVSSKNKLDLSNQGLNKVSQDVFKQTNLQELDVSNNDLTGALPAEIRHLQKLEILNASNNNMTGVPAEIGQINTLKIINLANNNLTGLPHELGNLQNLQILDLSGNNISSFDLDIIKNNLPSSVNIKL